MTGSPAEKRRLIDPDHPRIPVARQCELLGLNRSGWYYRPVRREPPPEELAQRRRLDELFTACPF